MVELPGAAAWEVIDTVVVVFSTMSWPSRTPV